MTVELQSIKYLRFNVKLSKFKQSSAYSKQKQQNKTPAKITNKPTTTTRKLTIKFPQTKTTNATTTKISYK